MTVYSQPVIDIAGAGDHSRFWFYREDNLSPSEDESAIITGGWVGVLPVAGVLTTPPLKPGPAKVSWGGKEYDLVIPDHDDEDPIPLWPDIQNYVPQPGPVVNAAVSAKEAAEDARDAAQGILDDVESGVVPDSGVAARVAAAGSATRTAVEARVRAVGDAIYGRVELLADGITYNGDGTVATSTSGGVTTTYTWNLDGTCHTETRLGKVKTWTYDGSGNPISSTVTGV